MSSKILEPKIYGFDAKEAGEGETAKLQSHFGGNYDLLKERMNDFNEIFFLFNRKTVNRLTEIEISAFQEHNEAEAATENKDLEKAQIHWKNVERLLTEYFRVIKKAFKEFGYEIDFDPKKLAKNETDCWIFHHNRNYAGVERCLTEKNKKLFGLYDDIALEAAKERIKVLKKYDIEKYQGTKNWPQTETAMIKYYRFLKRELRKKHKRD